MAFDPDEYLASKGNGADKKNAPSAVSPGFDPDAYLNSKQSGVVDRKMAAADIPELKAGHEPSLLEQMRDSKVAHLFLGDSDRQAMGRKQDAAYLQGLGVPSADDAPDAVKHAEIASVLNAMTGGKAVNDALDAIPMGQQGADAVATISGAKYGAQFSPPGGLGKAAGTAIGAMSGYAANRIRRALSSQNPADLGTPGELAQIGVGSALIPPGTSKLIPTALQGGLAALVAKKTGDSVDQGQLAPFTENDAKVAVLGTLFTGAADKLARGGNLKVATREQNAAENPMAESNRNAAPLVDEGARVIPSRQNPTLWNKIKDTIANPGEIAKASEIPTALANLKMSLRAIGVPEGQFATPEVLAKAKAPAQAVYNEITELGDQGRNMASAELAARAPAEGPHGSAVQNDFASRLPGLQDQVGIDLKAFQAARDKVSSIRSAMNQKEVALDSAGVPIDLQKLHDAAEATADGLKDNIISGLNAIKRGDLADKFDFAQKRFAQVGEIDRWANPNTGTVDPSKAFNVQNKTGKLTDELKTVADFRGAVGPGMDKELSRVSSIPGRLNRFGPTATAATVGGLAGGAPTGAVAAGLVEAMRRAALARQMSDAVQKASVAPRYKYQYIAAPDSAIGNQMRRAAIQQALQEQQ